MSPIDKRRYPKNWDSEIVPRELRKAGGSEDDPRVGAKCRFCGVQNYSVGRRDEEGNFILTPFYQLRDMYDFYEWTQSHKKARELADLCNDYPNGKYKWIVIILTTMHLEDPNPMNVHPDNLAIGCQKCHNNHDNPMRQANMKERRRQERNGQFEIKF